jgi:hypothetical protein
MDHYLGGAQYLRDMCKAPLGQHMARDNTTETSQRDQLELRAVL